MNDPDLISIGSFAERAGLTASALRYYDDAGVLRPDHVDPLTGYRMYSTCQLAQATQLRQLREIGMALPVVRELFESDAAGASRLIDEQLEKVTNDAFKARDIAAALKDKLNDSPRFVLCELAGPVFAGAVDQILASALDDTADPALNGVHIETEADAISLTATDRYRLATRTLVPLRLPTSPWAGTVAADELRSAVQLIRRSPKVTLEQAT